MLFDYVFADHCQEKIVKTISEKMVVLKTDLRIEIYHNLVSMWTGPQAHKV